MVESFIFWTRLASVGSFGPSAPFSLRPNIPLILFFIEGLVAGTARLESPGAGVSLPLMVVAADADVSEVVPSCEWVEAEDAEALDGSVACTFVKLAGGDSVRADMSCEGNGVEVAMFVVKEDGIRWRERYLWQRLRVSQGGNGPVKAI